MIITAFGDCVVMVNFQIGVWETTGHTVLWEPFLIFFAKHMGAFGPAETKRMSQVDSC